MIFILKNLIAKSAISGWLNGGLKKMKNTLKNINEKDIPPMPKQIPLDKFRIRLTFSHGLPIFLDVTQEEYIMILNEMSDQDDKFMLINDLFINKQHLMYCISEENAIFESFGKKPQSRCM